MNWLIARYLKQRLPEEPVTIIIKMCEWRPTPSALALKDWTTASDWRVELDPLALFLLFDECEDFRGRLSRNAAIYGCDKCARPGCFLHDVCQRRSLYIADEEIPDWILED